MGDSMQRKKMKRFSTGQFAQQCDVPKSTLFYYDKINLFKPAGVETNGYRYYTENQINLFMAITSLRDLGISIDELKQLFQEPSSSKLIAMVNAQLDQIEKQITKMNQTKNLLERMASFHAEVSEIHHNQLVISDLPERYIISKKYTLDRYAVDDSDWIKESENFVKQYGLEKSNNTGSIISYDSLIAREFDCIDSLFVFLEANTGTEVLEKGKYAIFYYDGSFDNLSNLYPEIIEKIHHMGYQINGNAYEEYMISSFSSDLFPNYITKITLPIKLK